MSSNQNSSPEESEPARLPDSDDNQPPPSAPIEPEESPIPSTTNTVLSTTDQTEPSNDQTEPPMEVHHHGHVHADKKWKEYLFQFLMLFLAITLGFFVENIREHYVEDQRAKALAKNLYKEIYTRLRYGSTKVSLPQ